MNHNLLTPLQQEVLYTLFEKGLGEHEYFLTGGTALAEFYLGHRLSVDLDFFTRRMDSVREIEPFVRKVFEEIGLDVERVPGEDRGRTGGKPTYLCYNVRKTGDSSPLKLDFVSGNPQGIAPIEKFGPVCVDSLEDIAVNKVTTIMGRPPQEIIKDFVDLYFILQECSWSLDYLIERSLVKDATFEDSGMKFVFADILRNVLNCSELFSKLKIVKPLPFDQLTQKLIDEADQLILRLKPSG